MSYIINAQTDFDDSIVEKIFVSYTIRVPSVPNFPENAVSPSRYVVRLYHVPYLADQVTYPITVGALSKVTASPSSGQFRIVDSLTRTRPHLIEFNSAQAGTAYTVEYYAIASIIDHQMIGFVPSITNSNQIYVLNERDHGVNLTDSIDDLPAGDKVIFLKNGLYNITTVLDFGAYGIVEFIGESKNGVKITCSIANANQIIINEAIVKNFTLLGTVTNNYGKLVSYTGDENGFIQNVTIIGNGDTGFGFKECSNLIGCTAQDLAVGFSECQYLTSCYAISNATGFGSSIHINNSKAYLNTGSGFLSCNDISSCRSTANGTYGYSTCLGMSRNLADTNTTQNYNQTGGALCYASRAVNATYVIAANGTDTANGGFNV